MSPKADFSDLTARALSAVVMLVVAGTAIWLGGNVFKSLLIVISALMAWEISQMHDQRAWLAIVSSVVVGSSVLFKFFPMADIHDTVSVALRLLPCFLVAFAHKEKARFTVFASFLVFIAATVDLGNFRQEQGLTLILWLLLCVIASDIGGYFAGKMLGGPKLWVRISPKKTWSGTLGGWALAAIVGVLFVIFAAQPGWIILASVVVAIAAQIGDLFESAIKRRAGVKDSSNLIPGHGGLLDRFDGVLGVCVLIAIAGFVGLL